MAVLYFQTYDEFFTWQDLMPESAYGDFSLNASVSPMEVTVDDKWVTQATAAENGESATESASLLASPVGLAFVEQVGGNFKARTGRVYGHSTGGVTDDSISQQIGSVDAAGVVSVTASNLGGWIFPFDVILKGFLGAHRNSSANMPAWGWVFSTQVMGTGQATKIYDELADAGTWRDYGVTSPQQTVIDDTVLPQDVIPAGTVINLGVAVVSGGSTSTFYTRMLAGALHFERA